MSLPSGVGGPEEFRSILLYNEETGHFDTVLSKAHMEAYMHGEDYLKVKNRKRLTGSVVTPGTPVTLYDGAYIALSILIHNPDTVTNTWILYDGNTKLVGGNGVSIAAGAIHQKELTWVPFETSVRIDASSPNVVFNFGGYIPE